MKILVSGEGPWDMGECDHELGECDGEALQPGPMTALIDQVVFQRMAFSPLDAHGVRLVWKTALKRFASKLAPLTREQRYPLAGLDDGKRGKKHHERFARALGERAKAWGEQEECEVIAVYFRDRDGEHDVRPNFWNDLHDSMKRGFNQVEGFDPVLGVPMIPAPKSEAWLLCARKSQPYQGCVPLEDEPGNDDALNPLKEQLADALGDAYDNEKMTEWIRSGRMDLDRLDMPSFCHFKKDLYAALEKIGCAPLTQGISAIDLPGGEAGLFGGASPV